MPVAAICGATIFLGRQGFLNDVAHTGYDLEFFQEHEGYKGSAQYLGEKIVVDGGFITAYETAAVQFAREIFKLLRIDNDEEIDIWYENFK